MSQLESFRTYISEKNLSRTPQREEIAKAFFHTKGHYSADELYKKFSKKNPKIGATTVYRTLKLLTECNLAKETTFDGKITRYEYIKPEDHHDHLICTECGKIIEFKAKDVEMAQERIANSHNFQVKSHKFELYGVCKNCQ